MEIDYTNKTTLRFLTTDEILADISEHLQILAKITTGEAKEMTDNVNYLIDEYLDRM